MMIFGDTPKFWRNKIKIYLMNTDKRMLTIWSQLGPNLAAKNFPKSTQVGSKIHQKLDQDAGQFFA